MVFCLLRFYTETKKINSRYKNNSNSLGLLTLNVDKKKKVEQIQVMLY